eukprot:CAMPEP_0117695586 /NCGR_PEP_ID=MMETSP0804-20121206/28214_1 /TAXON_ID=1074897 /ORGANISM="Tetraselmis astigmatica, Strain CCMP880" /LENGTH=175 /DNA_ID=CAMNT_0005509659 /DNA_START=393 /DNA_END=920 /DNA_ORIENTATION=-
MKARALQTVLPTLYTADCCASAWQGEVADVWSCGVTLYVMLVGAYPFEDPSDPRNFRKAIQRIMSVNYTIPSSLRLTDGCVDLIKKIFVADPIERLTVDGVVAHPWFQQDLPESLKQKMSLPLTPNHYEQSEDDIKNIVSQARTRPGGAAAAATADDFGDEFVDDQIDDYLEEGM